jgi:hypothetical protein
MLRPCKGGIVPFTCNMRRILVGGFSLLLCAAIAARSKTEPLIFVFLRVEHEQDLAILRPMIAPDIGVQLDSGTRNLPRGSVLRCMSSQRDHDAIVEGHIARVSDLLLDCGDQKFVVKTLDFRPQRQ